MASFIKVYQKMLPHDLCDAFIKIIDAHIETDSKCLTNYNSNWRNSRQLFFPNKETPESTTLWEQLRPILRSALDKYMLDTKTSQLKACTLIESPSILKYEQNQGQFANHSDAFNSDTVTRQLSVVIYLNTVETGGETKFPLYDTAVSPEKGSIALFPSGWTYMHCGQVPLSGPKYAIVTWYHFPLKGQFKTMSL